MASLLLDPFVRHTDNNGKPLSGGKLFFYAAGTTTDLTVYTDEALSVAHAQPVVSDSSGFFPEIYSGTGTNHKIVLKTSADVTLKTSDNRPPYISDSATLPVTSGGTGSTTASAARTALDAASASTVTTINNTVTTISTEQTDATWETGTATTATVVAPDAMRAAIIANARSGSPDALIWDQKASGTDGGTFTTGSWQTRELNQTTDPDSLIALSSNAFTPTVAGFARCFAVANRVNGHQLRIYNVTDAVALSPPGLTNYSAVQSGNQTSTAYVGGYLEAGKQYRLEHRSSRTQSNDGFGAAHSFGVEVYAIVEFSREKPS